MLQQLKLGVSSNKRLIVTLLLCLVVIATAWRVATLFWIVAAPAVVPSTAPVVAEVDQAKGPDTTRLKALQLFRGTSKPTVDIKPADVASSSRAQLAKSRLNITLSAIMSESQQGQGHAIVVVSNKQHLVSVGEAIPVRGRVLLQEVHPTEVVISNNGKLERLVLDKDSEIEAKTVSQTNSPNKDSIDEMIQSITLAPVLNGTQLAGVRIGAANDKARNLFAKVGLKEGDELVAVNGQAVSLQTNPAQLSQLINNNKPVRLSVRRNGQLQMVDVTAAQLTN